MSSRIHIGEAWLAVAEAMGHTLSSSALSMMLDNVSDLDPRAVEQTLRSWMHGNRKFPLPADIREVLEPRIDNRTLGTEAASRIVEAVSRFGVYQYANAAAYIGELGCIAVERIGGWEYLCQNLGTRTLPLTTAQAQLRDTCEAQAKLSLAGRNEVPPALPSREEAKATMKMIEEKKRDSNPDKGGKNGS